MDKFKEAAKLLRGLAELAEQIGETIITAQQTINSERTPHEITRIRPAPKWVKFYLKLEAPIGRPKAQRIIDRLAPTDQGRKQFAIQMGPGSNGTKTYVVAFIVKVTDRDGDAQEMAIMVAAKMDERGSDKRARAKVASVQAVA